MKRYLAITVFFILILASHAQAVSKEERADDKELPSIDELDIIQIAENVNELNWWVSDNLGLSRYEILKDGTRIKTKPIGGNKQSSKYQDLNAFGDHTYTFIVYDVAGNVIERNITLNKTAEEQIIEETIEETLPEEQLVIEAPKEELPPVEEEVVFEQPVEVFSGNFLAVIIVLIVLAVFWKLLTLKKPEKNQRQKRDEEIGMQSYIKQRSKRK